MKMNMEKFNSMRELDEEKKLILNKGGEIHGGEITLEKK